MDGDDHRITGCICTTPGFCERHKCRKSEHWLHLCQTRPDYFQAWEEGRGPGQIAERKPLAARAKKLPSTCCGKHKNSWWAIAWDFARAMAAMVVSGVKFVTNDQYKARLEVCNKCGYLDTESMRCKVCKCFVKIKARGKVWDCPKSLWPKLTEENKDG